jgi:hypothetical protein
MDLPLNRFWFEFEITNYSDYAPGLTIGCGVTAYNYDDALQILVNEFFVSNKMPEITRCVKNVDITELDQNHVVPNMKAPNVRGVWFPISY